MPKQYVRKYFIMGSQDCSRNPEDILAEAIHGGITAFQYREKGVGALKGDKKIALAKTLRSLCKKHDIPFFINDDVELIEMLQVDGEIGRASCRERGSVMERCVTYKKK